MHTKVGSRMAKPKPEKKPAAGAPVSIRVLPMELQIGDRFVSDTGEEWEVISRPYTSAGGKLASAHVQRVGQPRAFTDLRAWSAHERVAVRRE
jgi:hypothetical protein